MLKKTMTYIDFDGNERTEDFYFNLTKAELLEMEVSTEGGMERFVKKIIDSRNGKEIADIFKEIILRSYGEKSLDGKHFVKSKEISESFKNTQAYSDLYMELATDDEKAASFINGIIPNDYQVDDKEIEKIKAENAPKLNA